MDPMKTSLELSSFETNTEIHKKRSHVWIAAAVVVTLCIIVVILVILIGILFGNYSALNHEVSSLKSNVSEPVINNDVSELQQSVPDIMADLTKFKDSSMNNDLSVLKYNVSDIMADLSKLKDDVSQEAMKNNVSQLQNSVSDILADLSKLKEKDSAMNNELSILKYNVSEPILKNDVSELQRSVSDIMADVSELKAEDSTLNDELTILKSKESTMINELAALKSKESAVNTELSVLKYNVSILMDDVSKLKERDGSCTTCPSLWKLIRHNCYYFSTTDETWERSKEICKGGNGILAVIKDNAEMSSLWPTINTEDYWIGLKRDPANIDMWVWTDGSAMTYSVWYQGEPNNDGGNEHCAHAVGTTESWIDFPCHVKKKYICKGVWSC